VVGGGTPDTTVPSLWNGNIQWFTPTEVGHQKYVSKSARTITQLGLQKSSAKKLPAGSILLSSRATIGECSIAQRECTTNQGFQNLIPKNDTNNEFLYYLAQTKKHHFIKYASGSTFLEISNSEIRKTKCTVPGTEEQTQIAAFLSALDDRISVQNKIIEDLKILKKELCNDHFKSVLHDASLRYITLKEILTERKEYCSKDGTYTHGTLSKEGVAPKTERYDRDFLVKNEDKQYKVTHLNDICYNPANLKFGVICRNTYGDLIFSPIYVTFEISDNVYPAYIELFLTNPNFIGRIRRYEQGTVYERMAVSPEDFLSYETHIPAYEEQVEFANEMQRIQRKIELETAFLSSLQNQRRFFLNAMFI
jgi:type I restriction enzyme S subunit